MLASGDQARAGARTWRKPRGRPLLGKHQHRARTPQRFTGLAASTPASPPLHPLVVLVLYIVIPSGHQQTQQDGPLKETARGAVCFIIIINIYNIVNIIASC